jgi:DNA-binding response OmpR family regulator
MNNERSHILVVDDERAIRMTLETGLTLNGFRVTSAASGREAIEESKFEVGIQFAALRNDLGYWCDAQFADQRRNRIPVLKKAAHFIRDGALKE